MGTEEEENYDDDDDDTTTRDEEVMVPSVQVTIERREQQQQQNNLNNNNLNNNNLNNNNLNNTDQERYNNTVHQHQRTNAREKILRFTELMNPQISLEEEREKARERRRLLKQKRTEEEGEESDDDYDDRDRHKNEEEFECDEDLTDHSEGEDDDDDDDDDERRRRRLFGNQTDNERYKNNYQVLLDQDLNDDIDRKWRPGGRVDRDDYTLAERVVKMYESEKLHLKELVEDEADIAVIKKIPTDRHDNNELLYAGVEQKVWEDEVMWDSEDDEKVTNDDDFGEKKISSLEQPVIINQAAAGAPNVAVVGSARTTTTTTTTTTEKVMVELAEQKQKAALNNNNNRKSFVSVPKLNSEQVEAMKNARVKRWGEYEDDVQNNNDNNNKTRREEDEDSKTSFDFDILEVGEATSFQTMRLWTEIENDQQKGKGTSSRARKTFSNPNQALQDPNNHLQSAASKEDVKVLGQAEARAQIGGSHRLSGLDKLVVRLVDQSFLPPEAALVGEDLKLDDDELEMESYQELVSRELQECGAFEMLKRKNQDLLSGDWVNEVSWDGNPVVDKNGIIGDPSKMFSELRINPNDPDLDFFADRDLDGTEFVNATAKIWKTRDLPPVADFEKSLNISMDEAYAPEAGEEGEGLRTRHGRLDGIIHSDFIYQNPPSLMKNPLTEYPRPPPILVPEAPQASKKKIGFAGIRIAGPSADETFKINVKSLTFDSAVATLKVKSVETVASVIQRVRKRWPELEGDLTLFFPKAGVERQEPLEETMTLKECGVKPQVGSPILYIVSSKVHIISEEIATMRPMDDRALVPPGAFKKPSDLTIDDGHIMIVQYAEANPPLIAKPGMAAKKVTYYLRKSAGDQGARPLMGKGGQVFDLKPNAPSPFLSDLPPGVPVNVLETSMFRAPIFDRTPDINDEDKPGMFLLARGPTGKWSIREVHNFYVAGQIEPHVEVPEPNSEGCADIEERIVNSTIVKHFLELQKRRGPDEQHLPQTVSISDIAQTLNNVLSEDKIREKIRLKICAPIRSKEGVISKEDYALNPDYRFEHEKEIQKMCTPEDVCAYESMRHAIAEIMHDRTPEQVERMNKLLALDFQTLTNAVTILVRHAKGKRAKDLERIEIMLQMQPWSVTREFLANAAGKGVLHIEMSKKISKVTGKFWHYVRRLTKPPPPEELRPKVQPGTVTGTAADLRKLTMPQAAKILKNFGIEDEVILKLERWKRIGLIRELSGAATADGNATHQNMSRFARNVKLSEVQQNEELKYTSNFLFKKQFRKLHIKSRKKRAGGDDVDDNSSSGGDTDDGLNALCSDSEESEDSEEEIQSSDSESDSLAAELEAELAMKGRGPTEEEDMAELDSLRNELGGGMNETDPVKLLERGIIPEGKKLRLKRITTHTFPDGRQQTIEEDITDVAGEAWMRRRAEGLKAAEEAAVEALTVVGRAKPPAPPEEKPAEEKEKPKPKTYADKASEERAELVRRRKRAKERARRAAEKIRRLREQGLLVEGGDEEEELPEMAKPVPGQGLKLSLNTFKIKKAAEQEEAGNARKRAAVGGGGGPKRNMLGKPLRQVLAELTETAIKQKEFFSIFGTEVLLEDYNLYVESPLDLVTILNRCNQNSYRSCNEWVMDIKLIASNAKKYHLNEADIKLRLDWVPPLADKLVTFIEALLRRKQTIKDLKKADPSYIPAVYNEDSRTNDDDSAATAPKAKPTLKFSFKMKGAGAQQPSTTTAAIDNNDTQTITTANTAATETTGTALDDEGDDLEDDDDDGAEGEDLGDDDDDLDDGDIDGIDDAGDDDGAAVGVGNLD
jgi:transcription initiation factor TFIID subunit 1